MNVNVNVDVNVNVNANLNVNVNVNMDVNVNLNANVNVNISVNVHLNGNVNVNVTANRTGHRKRLHRPWGWSWAPRPHRPPQALAPAFGVINFANRIAKPRGHTAIAIFSSPQATASACTGRLGGGGPQDPTGHPKTPRAPRSISIFIAIYFYIYSYLYLYL